MEFGAPVKIRFSEEEATEPIEAGGFRVQTVKNWVSVRRMKSQTA